MHFVLHIKYYSTIYESCPIFYTPIHYINEMKFKSNRNKEEEDEKHGEKNECDNRNDRPTEQTNESNETMK